MEKELLLMMPGPVPIPERVRFAMSRQAINHRSAEFGAAYADCVRVLKTAFGTTNDLFIISGPVQPGWKLRSQVSEGTRRLPVSSTASSASGSIRSASATARRTRSSRSGAPPSTSRRSKAQLEAGCTGRHARPQRDLSGYQEPGRGGREALPEARCPLHHGRHHLHRRRHGRGRQVGC